MVTDPPTKLPEVISNAMSMCDMPRWMIEMRQGEWVEKQLRNIRRFEEESRKVKILVGEQVGV